MTETNDIGNRISIIRKIKKMKQSDLARATNIPTTTIGNYERGDRKISAENISSISKALKIPLDILVNGIPNELKNNYSYNFFVNADSNDWQTYYAELRHLRDEQFQSDLNDNYTFLRKYLKAIFELGMYNTADDLVEFVKWQKNNAINESRLEKIKYEPSELEKALKYDPFQEHEQELQEIKDKHYHMYFLDPVQKQLKQIIDNLDTSKEMNKDKLKEELQNILSTIEERDLDN